MKVEYNHNNSGGKWWLTDQNWLDLEAAGWEVRWFKSDPLSGLARTLGKGDGRWLGALAREATKEFPSTEAAIEEWARITGLNPDDDGCSCCGQPHDFSEAYSDE